MRHNRKTLLAAAGVATVTAIAAAVLIDVPAIATPSGGGFASTQLYFGTFGPIDLKADKVGKALDKWDLMLKSKGLTDIRISRVSFPAGATSGWHSHPGPNLLIVNQGTVTEYEESNPLCTGVTHTAGTATGTFQDEGGDHAHLVRNETGAAAEVIAIALYPNGVTPLRNDEPRPTNCPSTVL